MNAPYAAGLWTIGADGPALTNTVTATSLLGTTANQRLTLPPGFVPPNGVSTWFRFKAAGRVSTVITTPGNLTLDIRFGAVIVATSQAMALNIVAQTNATWKLEWDLLIRSVGQGTAATIMHIGSWISRASLNAPAAATTTGVGTVLIPDTAPAVGTGFSTETSQVLDFFGTFSVANAANSITCHFASFESLN